MERQKAVMIMKEWYSKKYVQFEIVFSGLRNREFAVLTPKTFLKEARLKGVRYLRVDGTDGFVYALNRILRFDSEERPLNLYYSLATYQGGVPVMSPVLELRKPDIEEWKGKMSAMITSYDCLIDVDSPDRSGMHFAKETAFRVKKYLDKYEIPYYLRFSGMGYHLIIPFEAFAHLPLHFNPHEEVQRSAYTLFNDITLKLNELFSELIDTGLHDSRRITKIPYSVAVYNDGCYVCWPFNTTQEFITKTWKDFLLDKFCNFTGQEKIFRRGQHLFNGTTWTPEKVNKFIESLKLEVPKNGELQTSTVKQATQEDS